MNLKKSQFSIQDKNLINLENSKEYPTLADLMKEQNVSNQKGDYLEKDCESN